MLLSAGAWASFMSINVIRKDRYIEWSIKDDLDEETDYIGFDLTLFSGKIGNCSILSLPILARIKDSLSTHRFNGISIYFF